MKVQAIIILSLLATALAVPESRFRRDANSTTQASATQATTTQAPSAVDCGSGEPTGLAALLAQLGNLLDNILANAADIKVAGLIGDQDDLINLRNLLNEVRALLIVLLGGQSLSSADTPENVGLVTTLIGSIVAVLDTIMGSGIGEQYACTNNGGLVGALLGGLTNGLLGGLLGGILGPVLKLVGVLLKLLI